MNGGNERASYRRCQSFVTENQDFVTRKSGFCVNLLHVIMQSACFTVQ